MSETLKINSNAAENNSIDIVLDNSNQVFICFFSQCRKDLRKKKQEIKLNLLTGIEVSAYVFMTLISKEEMMWENITVAWVDEIKQIILI